MVQLGKGLDLTSRQYHAPELWDGGNLGFYLYHQIKRPSNIHPFLVDRINNMVDWVCSMMPTSQGNITEKHRNDCLYDVCQLVAENFTVPQMDEYLRNGLQNKAYHGQTNPIITVAPIDIMDKLAVAAYMRNLPLVNQLLPEFRFIKKNRIRIFGDVLTSSIIRMSGTTAALGKNKDCVVLQTVRMYLDHLWTEVPPNHKDFVRYFSQSPLNLVCLVKLSRAIHWYQSIWEFNKWGGGAIEAALFRKPNRARSTALPASKDLFFDKFNLIILVYTTHRFKVCSHTHHSLLWRAIDAGMSRDVRHVCSLNFSKGSQVSMNLFKLACRKDESVVKELLRYPGMDVNKSHYSESPLIVAIKHGSPAIVKAVLKAGAYPDGVKSAYVPLKIALEEKRKDMVQVYQSFHISSFFTQ